MRARGPGMTQDASAPREMANAAPNNVDFLMQSSPVVATTYHLGLAPASSYVGVLVAALRQVETLLPTFLCTALGSSGV